MLAPPIQLTKRLEPESHSRLPRGTCIGADAPVYGTDTGAADGVASWVRGQLAEHFVPSIDVRRNKFVWLGTTVPYNAFTFLFSESAARAIVAVRPGAEADFEQICAAHGVPAETIGTVGGDLLEVEDSFTIALAELAGVHRGALPAIFS